MNTENQQTNSSRRRKIKKEPVVLAQSTVSNAVFLKPILLLLVTLYYSLTIHHNGLFFLPIVVMFFLSQYFLFFKNISITITEDDILLAGSNGDIVSINIEHDFLNTEWRSGKLGNFFNFGDIMIEDSGGEKYLVRNISDPEGIFKVILKRYDDIYTEKNPEYSPKFLEFTAGVIANNSLDSMD